VLFCNKFFYFVTAALDDNSALLYLQVCVIRVGVGDRKAG